MNIDKDWWKEGARFECQGSGKCCVSRGEYGYVYLTTKDRRAMAAHLGVSLSDFTNRFCERSDGLFHLKEEKGRADCLFLKNKRCLVYKARPTQCKTWPFWPENMNVKNWKRDVVNFCPGANTKQGARKKVSKKKIEAALKEQLQSDKSLGLV